MAVNLDASRVVVLAKQAQNAIGDAFVNTWNDDYKIPAKNICVKLELKYISTKRNEIG